MGGSPKTKRREKTFHKQALRCYNGVIEDEYIQQIPTSTSQGKDYVKRHQGHPLCWHPKSGPAFQFHAPAEKREEGTWSGEAQESDMIKPKKETC